MSRCPIHGCGLQARGVMCGRHWRWVPPALKRKVWSTWRSWGVATKGEVEVSDEEEKQRRKAYFDAQDEAIALVNKLESPCT